MLKTFKIEEKTAGQGCWWWQGNRRGSGEEGAGLGEAVELGCRKPQKEGRQQR